ncbi:MAG: YhfC family glutamic-type intramembrane protease, partial [Longicatena sp.]
MVEQLTIIEMFITLILSIILPLFLMLYLLVSKKIKAKSLIIGASGFLLTQFCVVSPMLTMLKKISFMGNEIISVFVSAIIIAGVDVLYTWWTFRYLLKTSKNRKNAISFGFGRGIMECFIGTGMATISNISLSLAISDGSIYKMTEISKESLERIVHVLTTAPGYIYLLSGIQSLCYILLYIIVSSVV